APPPVEGSLDVADEWFLEDERGERLRQRMRIWNEHWNAETDAMHEVVTIRLRSTESDDDAEEKVWHWLRLTNEGDRNTKRPVLCDVHVSDVERVAAKIVDALPMADELKHAVIHASKYHDHGKRRALSQ